MKYPPHSSHWLLLLVAGASLLAPAACERSPSTPVTPAAAPAKPAAKAQPTASTTANATKPGEPEAPAEPEQPPLPEPYNGPDKPIAQDAKVELRTVTPNGLVLEDFRIGTGAVALPKSVVWFKSIGRLEKDNKVFENTYESGKVLYGNVEQLVVGLGTGVVGMRVGGQRRVHVPAHLGYGFIGRVKNENMKEYVVPPDANLVFDIELMGVKSTFVNPEPPPSSAETKPEASNAAGGTGDPTP